jgi:hypothetical protein
MKEDGWYRLFEDPIDDIPGRIERLRQKYEQRLMIFVMLLIVGLLLLTASVEPSLLAIGGLLTVTAVAGGAALTAITHNQLCLYRTVQEMRQLSKLKELQS